MGVKFANSAYATLASSITSSGTSITLTTGQGARFPSLGGSDHFYATLIDTSNNLEIVKCTARSTDVLTVVRGQEGTTARAYSTSDRIELRITAQGIVDSSAIDVILPSQTGNSGKYLTTNGSASSWGTVDLTNLSASSLTSGTLPQARMFSKGVLRVEHAIFTGTKSTTSQSMQQLTEVNIAITPQSSSSKFLVIGMLNAGGTTNSDFHMILTRNGSAISTAIGDAAGSRQRDTFTGGDDFFHNVYNLQGLHGMGLDSPATTSSVTYGMQWGGLESTNAKYLNRSDYDGDNPRDGRGTCSLTVFEIAG